MEEFEFGIEGEMAGLINVMDWSKTSLGSINTWSISLRTQVWMMLSARQPMVIFWGPALVTLYNDSFRKSLGDNGQHPSSLGKTASACLAESWSTVGPMISEIMDGGKSVWFEDQKMRVNRNGILGSAYWTSGYSSLIDDDGKVMGVLLTCLETTKAVENMQQLIASETRLAISQQELMASFDEAHMAIAIFSKNNLVFKMANRFYGELVGRKVEDLLGRPMMEAIPEMAGQGFDTLIQRVLDTGEPFASAEIPAEIMRDGLRHRIFIYLNYQPLKDHAGNVDAVLVVASDISSSVESRRKIEESEERFRTLIATAPVGIALFIGPTFKIEVANETILQQWGKSKQVIGMPVLDALPEIADQRFPGLLKSVYASGKAHKEKAVEAILIKDGQRTTSYFDISYTPLFDSEGKVNAILDILIEVTETVIARRDLSRSEQFSKTIFYTSPGAMIVYAGPNMLIRRANENMLSLLGGGEELIGKSILGVIPGMIGSIMFKEYSDILQGGPAVSKFGEKLTLHRNGRQEIGYFDYTLKALLNVEGSVDGVMSTFVDVTEKVINRQKLEENQALLEGAIDLAGLGTWSILGDTQALSLTSPMKEWFEWNEETGDLAKAFGLIAEKDRERVIGAVQKVLDVNSDGIFNETYSLFYPLTGQQRVIHSRGKAVKDQGGTLLRVEGTAQDITAQKELQSALENEVAIRTSELAASNEELLVINEELEESNLQILRSNEELAQYAYVASHDLQEPLRKIRIYSSILADQTDLSEHSAVHVYKIARSAERMSLLIKDLLTFSRLLKNDMIFTDVDLNSIIQSVWNDFELMVEEKEATLQLTDLPTIQGVTVQINQLFYNLIGNALKFVAPGTKPWISVHAAPADDAQVSKYVSHPIPKAKYISLAFRDNGIGFENEHAEKIFEVFKRLHTRDLFDGSGIGLALCRRIAVNHQGFLYATSEPHKGSSFYLLLPETQNREG